jgi:hypothetical protein
VGQDQDQKEITKSIEGEYFYYDIGTREGLSALQLFRNFQTALQKAGYKTDYSSSPDTLTVHKGPQYIYMQFSDTYYYLTTVKQQEMKQEATATPPLWETRSIKADMWPSMESISIRGRR